MKHILACLLLLVLISMSCDKIQTNQAPNIEICGVDDAFNNLEWLKEWKNSITNCACQTSILEGMYNGIIVYYLVVSDPLCNSSFDIALIDCNGELVKLYRSNEFNIFAEEVETIRSIYTCTDK